MIQIKMHLYKTVLNVKPLPFKLVFLPKGPLRWCAPNTRWTCFILQMVWSRKYQTDTKF